MREKVIQYLKELLSKEIKLSPDRIDNDKSFEKYGIDSITIINLNKLLESQFGPISKTLFYEYKNVSELSDYFIRNHMEILEKILPSEHSYEPVVKTEIKQEFPSFLDNKLKLEGLTAQKPADTSVSVLQKSRMKKAPAEIVQEKQEPLNSDQDIAIIGVSGRYPMAGDLEELWKNISQGMDCITTIPKSRWDNSEYLTEKTSELGKIYLNKGGFMEDIDKFDPLFFGISPNEANFEDPHERLFLETIWHTMEDGGYTKKTIAGERVGVYVGVMWGQYQLLSGEVKGTLFPGITSYASIANRVSYFLDLKGPSIAIDSMCSSSLTAIHLACESIKSGESTMAFAGGVNLNLHPNKYIQLCAQKFASKDGHCKSFGEGGDGYVPGEGVGAVLLKPLSQAISDKDYIYGVIKATSINHGGETNGYSVPSPNAQAQVISETLHKTGISARDITYVEAHGTGTALGDPIEISGLSKAFREYSMDKDFCSIGSIKSNIGHLEGAAGIAAVTKVLLQMKYKKLAPSLFSAVINPNIDFEATPFHVQQELKDWQPTNSKGIKIPRIAAVSSFGAGGSNAHALIQEYSKEPIAYSNKRNNIFLLSAVNEDRLREYADLIVKDIENHYLNQNQEESFEAYLYTLQTGREEMECRLGVIAGNFKELFEKLTLFLADKNPEGVYTGNSSEGREGFHKYLKDFIDETYLKNLMEQEDFKKLSEIWILGGKVDWSLLYKQAPNKLPLPGYPFAKESYWAGEQGKITGVPTTINNGARLAPFIDENLSTFVEQCYKKVLTGGETYLAHHVIQGNKILPGSIYLEFILEAVQLSFPGYTLQTLDSIQWVFPFISKDKREDIYTRLYTKNEDIAFEIYSLEKENKNVHCTGLMGLTKEFETSTIAYEISEIKEGLEEIHIPFKEAQSNNSGYHYGPYYQCIKELYVGKKEVLASLKLDHSVHESKGYILHPALIDGAFQSVIGFQLDSGDNRVYLPYLATDIILYKELKDSCYVYIKEKENTQERKEYKMILLDEQGSIIAEIRKFVLKAAALLPTQLKEKNHYFTKHWIQKSIFSPVEISKEPVLVFAEDSKAVENMKRSFPNQTLWVYNSREVRMEDGGIYTVKKGQAETFVQFVKSLKNTEKDFPKNVLFYWNREIDPENTEIIRKAVEEEVLSVYYFAKALISEKIQSRVNILFLYKTKNDPQPQYDGLAAFGTVLKKEYPGIKFKAVSYDKELTLEEIQKELSQEMDRTEVSYLSGLRYVSDIRPLTAEDYIKEDYIKEGSVLCKGKNYLITGGLGGIGYIYAKYLAKTYQAGLTLIGRSPLDDEKKNQIEELKKYGREVLYLTADVTDSKTMSEAIIEAKNNFGEINGVIHCSGVLRDSYLVKKSDSDIKTVLAPKIYGVSILDNLLKSEKLDFFVLCSSVAAISANAGQTDYAYANSYMDNYSKYRNHLVKHKERYGRTLSVNWPIWENGGMQITEDMLILLKETMGLIPLENENGINALETLLKVAVPQVMVLEGNREKIYKSLGIVEDKQEVLQLEDRGQTPKAEGQIPKEEVLDKADIHKGMTEYLKEAVAYETGLGIKNIVPSEELTRYGLESVKIMNLTQALEEDFGELSKTLFYEYLNINDLTGYFISNHFEKVSQIYSKKYPQLKVEKDKQQMVSVMDGKNTEGLKKLSLFPSVLKNGFTLAEKQKTYADTRFAIIGLSGRYPKASDLTQFWDNLCKGLDCITTVPRGHWTSDVNGSSKEKWNTFGGFLDHIDMFDPLFFHISPKEAVRMDPQERLFLETAWAAIEDAAYTRKTLKNYKTGVFVGAMNSEYQLLGLEENLKGNEVNAGAVLASISNRVSYCLDLTGPSITLDTMCSSALTAIAMACENIQLGYCDMAIAGGVNLSLHPSKYRVLSTAHFLSSEGKCRSFGEGGDGYVPGEGAGAVLIKPLARAIEDKDNIYGVILGSNINHGGKTNGYSVPSPTAQKEAVLNAIERAGIRPETISYIEAHGTGTALGDPIEIDGLTKAFGKYTDKKGFCAIGSVKSNIGHLESAAGMAGLTKILLQMKHHALVPSLHAQVINKNIKFKETPFYIQDRLESWKGVETENGNRKLLAGLSSFGAGGTNVHMILENYEKPIGIEHADSREELFILSAREADRLREYADKLLCHLKGKKEVSDNSTIIQEIKELIAETIGVNSQQIDEGESLFEYGIDPIAFTSILDQINERYLCKIVNLPGENSTVTSLADKILLQQEEPNLRLDTNFYRNEEIQQFNLSDISYTLLTGREEMGERLAIVASSVWELISKLEDYMNHTISENMYYGNIRDNSNTTLMDSKAGRQFTKQLLEEGDYNSIAQLWVTGVSFEWSKLWEDNRGRKTSLPTYPFAKEPYWISKSKAGLTPAWYKEELVPMNLTKNWVKKEVTSDKAFLGKILILYRNKSEALAKNLFQNNDIAQKLYLNVDEITGLIGKKEEERRLLAVNTDNSFLEEFDYKEISALLDITSLLTEEEDRNTALKITGILQKVVKLKNTSGCHMIQLTSGLQDFQGSKLSLSGALTAGIYKMLGAEYKKLITKTVDIDCAQDEKIHVESIEKIISGELAEGEDREVCYRLGDRYIPQFLPHRVDLEVTPQWMAKVSKEQAIVITGGTRGIGLAVAEMLLENGYKKLALMGFSPIPEEVHWQKYLEDNKNNSRELVKVQGLYGLKQAGGELMIYTGSLEDKEELEKYFGKVEEKLGKVAGVIHCAGIPGSGSPAFIHKTPMDFEKVYSPKVTGLETLHHIFKDKQLEFFLLFSSISAAFIPLSSGLSDYSAANSYMDYFAAYQRSKGFTAYQSINWTNWNLGMAEEPSQIYNQLGLKTMTATQGMAIVRTVLGNTRLVKNGVLGMFQKDYQPIIKLVDIPEVKTEAVMQVRDKKILDNGLYADAMMKELKTVFSEELNIPLERLEEQKNFVEFGVDSILMADLILNLEKRFDTKLDPSIVLEYPTLEQLAGYLTQGGIKYSTDISTAQLEVAAVREILGDRAVKVLEAEAKEVRTAEVVAPVVKYLPQERKIAVIGLACHFPKAENKDRFWINLVDGVDCITEVPKDRWDTEVFYSAKGETGKSISKWGGFLDKIQYFDPLYFGFPQEGAEGFDPLLRQMLEVSAETFQDAGYTKDMINNQNIGVFVGSRTGEYASRFRNLSASSLMGVAQNFIATHVSQAFNLHGPACVIDTACSSSLVSIHIACQSILSGDSDMAISGGVDILLDEKAYVTLSASQALSPDGRCHTFDERANGFVPGEGAGAVLLKEYDRAVADGDKIYGLIDATAINNDGKTMGVTTPNLTAQEAVITRALQKANITPDAIDYIETHGTGTMIGDPIELKALRNVFEKTTNRKNFCGVGSVKTNVGHMMSAAGIGSFIKVILSLHHKIIPASLNCINVNPRFHIDDSPFYICRETKPFVTEHQVRRAGISSFGFGGTNAHVILSECPERTLERGKREELSEIVYHRKEFWLEKKEGQIEQKSRDEDERVVPRMDGRLKRSMFEIEDR